MNKNLLIVIIVIAILVVIAAGYALWVGKFSFKPVSLPGATSQKGPQPQVVPPVPRPLPPAGR